MRKVNYFYFIIFSLIFSQFSFAVTRLSQLDFHAASVLPYYYRKNAQGVLVKYFILSRERIDARGADRGTFDDFGGAREPGQTHPIQTATHEFFEEAIAEKTLGLTLRTTQKLIEDNVTRILAQKMRNNGKYYVLYMIKLDSQEVNNLFTKFEDARNTIGTLKGANAYKFREKDQLVAVKAIDLQQAIQQRKNTVKAMKRNSKNGNFDATTITLRPVLFAKLRNYFNQKAHEVGANPLAYIYS